MNEESAALLDGQRHRIGTGHRATPELCRRRGGKGDDIALGVRAVERGADVAHDAEGVEAGRVQGTERDGHAGCTGARRRLNVIRRGYPEAKVCFRPHAATGDANLPQTTPTLP